MVARINQHENKQSYNLKKLLMKAINKAFYESAVQAHTYTHPNDKVHDQHVFHTKCQSDCCLHTVNHSISFFLSLAVTFALISLYSASSFHPHDGHHRKLNHHFTHTHSLTHSFFLFIHFLKKGLIAIIPTFKSRTYWSYCCCCCCCCCVWRRYRTITHTHTHALKAYVYKTTGVEILWQRRDKLSTK